PSAQLIGDRGDPKQLGYGITLRSAELRRVRAVRTVTADGVGGGGFGHGITRLSVRPLGRAADHRDRELTIVVAERAGVPVAPGCRYVKLGIRIGSSGSRVGRVCRRAGL